MNIHDIGDWIKVFCVEWEDVKWYRFDSVKNGEILIPYAELTSNSSKTEIGFIQIERVLDGGPYPFYINYCIFEDISVGIEEDLVIHINDNFVSEVTIGERKKKVYDLIRIEIKYGEHTLVNSMADIFVKFGGGFKSYELSRQFINNFILLSEEKRIDKINQIKDIFLKEEALRKNFDAKKISLTNKFNELVSK